MADPDDGAAAPAGRLGRAIRGLDAAHPALPCLAVVLLALAVRLGGAALLWHATLPDGVVRGVPFSDGRGWDALAAGFSEGVRWDPAWEAWGGRRPLYWIFLGSVYALAGPSTAAARAVQILLGAVAAGLVFDAVRRLANARVALAAAVGHALLPYHAYAALATLTEPLGDFLADSSLWAVALGVERCRRRGVPRLGALLAGGILLGLSNLARPLSLPAAAAIPVALAILRRPGREIPGHGARFAPAAAFLAGVLLALAPWLLRQHARFGIWALSENEGEMLYAASSPAFGTWRPEVSALAGTTPVADRHRFYMDGFRANLGEHPGFYARNVLRHAAAAAAAPALPERLLLGHFGEESVRWTRPLSRAAPAAASLALLALLLLHARAASPARPRVTLRAAALLAPALLFPEGRALAWVAGALLALGARGPMSIVAAYALSTLLSLSLVAVPAGDVRLVHALDPPAAALAALALGWILARAAGAAPAPEPPTPAEPGGWGAAGRTVRLAAGLAGLLLVAGLGTAVARNLGPARPAPPLDLPPDEARGWIDRALREEALAPAIPLRERLEVRRASLRPGRAIRIGAGEGIRHWSALFRPRPYPFAICETRPAPPELHAVIPGGLEGIPEGGEWVLVGLRVERPADRTDGTSFEVLALFGDRGAGPIRAPDPVARAHAEHVRRLVETGGRDPP